MKKIFIALNSIFFLTNCNYMQENCSCKNECKGEIISKYQDEKVQAVIIREDNGAFGYSGNLKICNRQNSLQEEIGLRAEDYLPRIDSIKGLNVFISYDFPLSARDRRIEFNDVVLGDALINKEQLEYKYYFTKQ
ncbi:hypothetical protein NF867_07155 [Solitalea sp. MAHUQ-68]|uniref:Uncharacterized protein n=1 Tax=Solitalea agri TaxID=2953739 RepID=A0A9X2F8S5_9SPHI|nr:hypothetical protein [Solitalea agri]MCO4292633.1 hypothetical protein [Solitalea agri]